MAAVESTTDSELSAMAAIKRRKGRVFRLSSAIFPPTLVCLDLKKSEIEDFMSTLGLCN